ncbi:MAG: hypothetical protein KDI33_17340 [Halioglobus sp.]|nr:hypothetical protein [Halioglobus sp.]
MLRITVLSLLLGVTALIVALTQFLPAPDSARQQSAAIIWDTAAVKVVRGTPTITDNALQLELDKKGKGLVSLGVRGIDAQDFSFIHLALEEPAEGLVVTISWTSAQAPHDSHAYVLENHTRDSLWLATEELRGWSGQFKALKLGFSGRAGDTVLIEDFSVFPASAKHKLLAVYSDLTGYAPWNTAAMNTYTGAFNASSYYPIVLAVAFLLLSLLAYGLLLVLFRTKLRFNWAVVALIFLTNWVILDMLWQFRLLHQLADTHRLFAGKNTEERLAVGPDAALYNFASAAKPLMDSAGSRIFVTSSDTYSGMRTAYYFYPRNVYWALYGPALPRNDLLHKGDYIVLVAPSTIRFNRARGLLHVPKRRDLKAELVYTAPSGTVVRLK